MKKNQKNPGCPRRESQGLQPGLQPGATQDPGEEGFNRNPLTRGDPGSRIFFHFFDFFRFLAFSKKNQKNQKKKKFDFFGFSKKIKKIKKKIRFFWFFEKNQNKSRVPPQGESRAPARAPAWSHSGSGRGGIPTARNPPTQRDPGSRIFFIFLIFLNFFVFWPFRKKIKKIKKNLLIFLIFLVFRKK